jgi:hypothetical protein
VRQEVAVEIAKQAGEVPISHGWESNHCVLRTQSFVGIV